MCSHYSATVFPLVGASPTQGPGAYNPGPNNKRVHVNCEVLYYSYHNHHNAIAYHISYHHIVPPYHSVSSDLCKLCREELDSLCWKLVSGQPQHRKNVLASLKRDPLLAAYRLQVYDGAASVEEIFEMMGQQHNILAASGSLGMGSDRGRSATSLRSRLNSSDSDSVSSADSRANFSRELETWADLWDMRNTTVFKEGQDKICVDFAKLATIASIAHSCDWLVKLICKLCAASLKKLSIHQQNSSGTSRRTMSLGVNLGACMCLPTSHHCTLY
jgi:hypothetical protein